MASKLDSQEMRKNGSRDFSEHLRACHLYTTTERNQHASSGVPPCCAEYHYDRRLGGSQQCHELCESRKVARSMVIVEVIVTQDITSGLRAISSHRTLTLFIRSLCPLHIPWDKLDLRYFIQEAQAAMQRTEPSLHCGTKLYRWIITRL